MDTTLFAPPVVTGVTKTVTLMLTITVAEGEAGTYTILESSADLCEMVEDQVGMHIAPFLGGNIIDCQATLVQCDTAASSFPQTYIP
ncbi:MAG: hypothetical protein H0X24_13380 [Ktedonobacterales bacterium]|nr:hypothetical protein [Ktedonobacterales bacterium]